MLYSFEDNIGCYNIKHKSLQQLTTCNKRSMEVAGRQTTSFPEVVICIEFATSVRNSP